MITVTSGVIHIVQTWSLSKVARSSAACQEFTVNAVLRRSVALISSATTVQ